MIKKILSISRPRFWVYTAGTFMIGYVLSIQSQHELLRWEFFLLLFYFFFPANFLMYGVNDLFDADTDQFNSKKEKKEYLYKNADKPLLIVGISVSLICSLALFFFVQKPIIKMLLFFFVALSLSYSIPPLRLKARPFIDALSNSFYSIPGFIGYLLFYDHPLSPLIMLGAICWTSAMHLFSAIPDISADTKATLRTTAVVLGEKRARIVCVLLWTIAAFSFTIAAPHFPVTLAMFTYALLPLVTVLHTRFGTRTVYWWFPYITFFFGLSYFFIHLLQKPYS